MHAPERRRLAIASRARGRARRNPCPRARRRAAGARRSACRDRRTAKRHVAAVGADFGVDAEVTEPRASRRATMARASSQGTPAVRLPSARTFAGQAREFRATSRTAASARSSQKREGDEVIVEKHDRVEQGAAELQRVVALMSRTAAAYKDRNRRPRFDFGDVRRRGADADDAVRRARLLSSERTRSATIRGRPDVAIKTAREPAIVAPFTSWAARTARTLSARAQQRRAAGPQPRNVEDQRRSARKWRRRPRTRARRRRPARRFR